MTYDNVNAIAYNINSPLGTLVLMNDGGVKMIFAGESPAVNSLPCSSCEEEPRTKTMEVLKWT